METVNPAVELPKSSVDGFELPCGYIDQDGKLHTQVEIREITGPEEEILAATNMMAFRRLNRLMIACTAAIGPYRGEAAMEKIIPDLCQGDRFFIMFAIRRVSLGNDMPFISKCPHCDQEQKIVVDLSELEVKAMPDPKRRTYPIVLPKSGHKVLMKVLTGRGEDSIARALQSGKDRISTSLLARIDSMNDKPCTLEDLKVLGLMDRNFLRDAWEDNEGGIDTSIDMECPSCAAEYQANVDPSQEGFFNPLAVLKRWNKKSST
jgi:hypothetical protein